MPKGEVLYMKGMRISESDASGTEVDVWDDTKLNEAYDKALRMAKSEVAKRIAMSTNKDSKKKNNPTPKSTNFKNSCDQEATVDWKAGMPCRAVYKEDGLEYEAFLLEVIDDEECVVRFLGYDNTEIVPVRSLKKSLGKEERMLQIECAYNNNVADVISAGGSSVDGMELDSDHLSGGISSGQHKHNKKKWNKKHKQWRHDAFALPGLPPGLPPAPPADTLRRLGRSEPPLAPPPPLGLGAGAEDQALSSMLLSWYMSGYYTGLYQGLKRARRNKDE